MTKPSEGPFQIDQRPHCVDICGGPNGLVLASFFAHSAGMTIEEALANARLFVAAPDLLSIVLRFIALPGGAWHPERHAAAEIELMQQARAAIKEAAAEAGYRMVKLKVGLKERTEVLQIAEKWRPFRTVASWYLWRAVDLHRQKPPSGRA